MATGKHRKSAQPASSAGGDFSRETEAQTRERIDAQLRQAGWEVDSKNLTFAKIYDIKELDDIRPDAHTRLHLAAVQGMVKRLLYPSTRQPPIPVDRPDAVLSSAARECLRKSNLDWAKRIAAGN